MPLQSLSWDKKMENCVIYKKSKKEVRKVVSDAKLKAYGLCSKLGTRREGPFTACENEGCEKQVRRSC